MSSKKSFLDTKTNWEGLYFGLNCGISIESSSPKIKENDISLIITKVQDGYYTQIINGKKGGAGVSYIDPNGLPVLQFVLPNGLPSLLYATEIGKKNQVKKIEIPIINGFSKYSGLAHLKRKSSASEKEEN